MSGPSIEEKLARAPTTEGTNARASLDWLKKRRDFRQESGGRVSVECIEGRSTWRLVSGSGSAAQYERTGGEE